MSAILMKAYRNSKEGYAGIDLDAYNDLSTFQETLDRMGIGFARATREEAERSQRQASFAKAVGNYTPRFQEGEIVAVRAWNKVYRNEGETVQPGQRVYKLDQEVAQRFVATLGVDQRLAGIEPTKKLMEVKVQDHAQKRRNIRLENARKGRGAKRTMGDASVLESVGLGSKTGRIVGKTLDTFADAFESIFSPVRTPEQSIQDEVQKHRREVADHAAQQQREQQDQQIRRQIERDR